MLWLLALPQERVMLTARHQMEFLGLLLVNKRLFLSALQWRMTWKGECEHRYYTQNIPVYNNHDVSIGFTL